jgi:hypothetical protein
MHGKGAASSAFVPRMSGNMAALVFPLFSAIHRTEKLLLMAAPKPQRRVSF